MPYPINHHILAEDFKDQDAGRDGFSQDQAKWLLDNLRTMCNAYDERDDAYDVAFEALVYVLENDIEYLEQEAIDRFNEAYATLQKDR